MFVDAHYTQYITKSNSSDDNQGLFIIGVDVVNKSLYWFNGISTLMFCLMPNQSF